MIEVKMLPCPFCGNGKRLTIEKYFSEDDPSWCIAKFVRCGVCYSEGRKLYPIGWVESDGAAIEAWNDRGPGNKKEEGL
jgi:hypothetical protein